MDENQKKAEATAKHEARMAVLKMIVNTSNNNNSGSINLLASAYASLCTEPPTMPKPYERPAPTAMPGPGIVSGG